MKLLSTASSDQTPKVGAIVIAAFLGYLGGQIAATVLTIVGVHLSGYPGGLSALGRALAPPWWANALGLVGLWCGFGAAIYYAYVHGHLRTTPGQWRPRVSDLGYVALGVACQLVVDLAYRPFHPPSLDRPVHHLFAAAHGAGFVLLIVMTVVLAPVMEEWLFRGVIYRGVAQGGAGRGSVVRAVALSAVLFALAHAELVQFVGLAFLGVVLAVLVARSGRLVPSIVTHVSFNAVAVLALLAQRSGH